MTNRGLDYQALFLGSPSGCLVTAEDDTIIAVNDGFLIWTGWTREELLGTTFLSLLPIGDRILFSTRTAPLLHLSGRIPEVALSLFGPGRGILPASLVASRVTTDRTVTMFTMGPRRERSVEESHVITAVRQAEASDVRREKAEQGLDYLAHHDVLTGLLNRNGLLAELTTLIDAERVLHGEAGSHHRAFTVYQIGLDHFRIINESLGRTAGDDTLRAIASRLRRVFPDATIGRVGEDEFAVAERSEHSASERADRILAAAAEPMTVEDVEIVVTASLGFDDHSDESHRRPSVHAEALLRNAAAAMHEAKAAGRNKAIHFSSNEASSVIDDIRLLGEMRAGIPDGHFHVDYQPQLDLRTGRTHGLEALIRWDHPDRGLVPPDRFIPMAERSGLIGQLGAWISDRAIRQCAVLNAVEGAAPITVSINVSARQLGDPRFVRIIGALLQAYDVDPALITLELTETALILDAAQAQVSIRALKELGVRLSIDDFGTGHAGFGYLKNFAVDEIKIDRSYIDNLDVVAEDTAIVVGCIELAHALGITVVAEGIETQAQLARLTELRCDIAQGFLYARPLAEQAVRDWLLAHSATQPR